MENKKPETVLISGGNGLIGRYLFASLKSRGYLVSVIGRASVKKSEFPQYTWDLDKNELDQDAIINTDYIIHLAGANIGERRWTEKRKQEIADSRIKSSQLLFERIKDNNHKLKAFISASAVGYYGAITTEKIYSENDPPGKDFLGVTCERWEKSVSKIEEMGIRTVKIRTGVVLTKNGGALAKMLVPIKLGLGSALGSGKQYMPWIHIDDLCNMYIKAIEDTKMKGAYNAVAPEHITNNDFVRTLSNLLRRPLWFPNIPAFVLRIIFGEMSVILLKGSRVSSDKIKKTGYNFLFPDLQVALQNFYTKQ